MAKKLALFLIVIIIALWVYWGAKTEWTFSTASQQHLATQYKEWDILFGYYIWSGQDLSGNIYTNKPTVAVMGCKICGTQWPGVEDSIVPTYFFSNGNNLMQDREYTIEELQNPEYVTNIGTWGTDWVRWYMSGNNTIILWIIQSPNREYRVVVFNTFSWSVISENIYKDWEYNLLSGGVN